MTVTATSAPVGPAATLNVKAFYWIIPAGAKVKVIDVAWHKMGDVDWDGVIDQVDIDMLTAAYGSQAGDSNWNPDCDLNGDGKVDLKDMGIASKNIGKTVPERTAPFSATVGLGRCVLIATYQDYVLMQDLKDLKITDKKTILFEFNIFKGRVVVLGGAGGNLPGLGLVQRPTTEIYAEL
jgi:hypothetical protein